jgi:ABC-type multidrug transport system fused ATPase/permease subunit
MLIGMLRSPSKYFDVTPNGRLISRFSNDLGIMDAILAFTMIDTI